VITAPTTTSVSTILIVTINVSVSSAAITVSNQSKVATPAANLDHETLSNTLESETEPL
jgi:hypothetical protein